jgi:hypothetical protein
MEENIETLLGASRDAGEEINAEKAKYMICLVIRTYGRTGM